MRHSTAAIKCGHLIVDCLYFGCAIIASDLSALASIAVSHGAGIIDDGDVIVFCSHQPSYDAISLYGIIFSLRFGYGLYDFCQGYGK